MHDNTPDSLRKQALKQGTKTVSKKAQSKATSLSGSRLNSRRTSAANSRVPSAAGSRAVSERGSVDADGSISDPSRPDTPDSIDALLAGKADQEDDDTSWQEHLAEVISQIEDRNWKSSNTQTRQEALVWYIRLLSSQFAQDDIAFRLNQLVGAFVKIVKAEDDPLEVSLALKALSVTIITSPSEEICEVASAPVKRAIMDSSDVQTKILAIQTLAVLTFYGDLSEEALGKELDFFLEIVSTDGEYIDALDEAEPVAAALEAWGFVATLIEEEEHLDPENAFETFVEQLDSSSTSVLIAAGENIALLYEKAYAPVSEEEIEDERAADIMVISGESERQKQYYKKLYDLYPRPDILESKLRNLQKHSSRSVSKNDRKALHTSFADVLGTVQHPTRGPAYSTALVPGSSSERGHKMKLKSKIKGETNNDDVYTVATIDKWWMLHRHRALKEVLGSGFMAQYEVNPAIFEALPIVFVPMGDWKQGKKGSFKPWQQGGGKATIRIDDYDNM